MGYVLSTLNQKGGVGKSTIAINLAVFFALENKKVLLIDADDNKNSTYWIKRRSVDPEIDLLELKSSAKLTEKIAQYLTEYDYIIIDGSPKISEISMSIMLLSDLCLFPVKASQFDYETTRLQFAPKFHEAKHFRPKLKGAIVLNEISKREKLTKETQKAIQKTEIPLLKTFVRRYIAFRESLMFGLGSMEYKHIESNENILNLGKEIKQILKN